MTDQRETDELAAVVTPSIEIDGVAWRAGDIGIDALGREVKLTQIGRHTSAGPRWCWEAFGLDVDIPLDMIEKPLAKVHLVKVGEEAQFALGWR